MGGRSLNDDDDDEAEFSGEYAESPARLTRHRIPATRVEGGTMAWDMAILEVVSGSEPPMSFELKGVITPCKILG